MSYQNRFEIPGQSPEVRMHRTMAGMALKAKGVCFDGKVTDEAVFTPIPMETAPEDYEPGRVVTERNDIIYAFTSAFLAEAYGPASGPEVFKVNSGDSVGKSLYEWDRHLSAGYRQTITPIKFRDVFFRGGLGKVFFDPKSPEMAPIREALSAPDFGGLDKSRRMLEMVEAMRLTHFVRDQYPHVVSHLDAARFINTVLDIGYRELGLKSPHELEAHMRRNLDELKAVAMISNLEMDVVSVKMKDPLDRSKFKRDFFDVDTATGKVKFNDQATAELIEKNLPDAGTHIRRGCPVLFQKTEYQGRQTPVFTVMNEVLVRIYRESGAFQHQNLRRLS